MAEPLRVFQLIKSLGRGGAEMLLPEGLRFADRTRFTCGYGYSLPWKDAMVVYTEPFIYTIFLSVFVVRTRASDGSQVPA